MSIETAYENLYFALLHVNKRLFEREYDQLTTKERTLHKKIYYSKNKLTSQALAEALVYLSLDVHPEKDRARLDNSLWEIEEEQCRQKQEKPLNESSPDASKKRRGK